VITGTGQPPGSWNIPLSCSAQIGFAVPGPDPYMVSVARVLEPMVAQPVFEGNRMYLRTYKSAMCIAADTEEGRRLMLQRKAMATLNALPQGPLQYGVWRVPPPAGFKPPAGVPVGEFAAVTEPKQWLFAGPFAVDVDTDPLAAIGGAAAARPAPGKPFDVAGGSAGFKPLPEQFVAAGGLDVVGPISGAQPAVGCFYTVLHSDGERIVLVKLDAPRSVRVWMAGQWIRNNNTIRLKRGYYPVMLYSRLPKTGDGPARVALSFKENEEFKDWKPMLRRHRHRIESVIKDLPGSEQARIAQEMLDSIEE
jgi:hypothetical protein